MQYIEESYQKRIQRNGLDILCRNSGFEFTNLFFPYTSVEIGNYYVQSAVVMREGNDFDKSVKLMRDLITIAKNENNSEIEIITGGETRDLIFSMPVAALMKKPCAMIYKSGECVGASLVGRTATHVADLNNEGYSLENYWLPIIRKNGGDMREVFFFVDRLEDGAKVVDSLNIRGHAAVPLNVDAWEYLQKKEVISGEIYLSLQERLEDKTQWAHRMLKSDKGLNELKRILLDSSTIHKGIKIINAGYPELREELVDRLSKIGLHIGEI